MNQLRILQALGSSSIMCQRLRSNSEREREKELVTGTESLMRCISLLLLLKADFGGDKEVVWPRSQAFST